MNERIKKLIKERADEIREKIEGGTLFGEPLDMDDVDSLVVAAYSAGEAPFGLFERMNNALAQPRRKPR